MTGHLSNQQIQIEGDRRTEDIWVEKSMERAETIVMRESQNRLTPHTWMHWASHPLLSVSWINTLIGYASGASSCKSWQE